MSLFGGDATPPPQGDAAPDTEEKLSDDAAKETKLIADAQDKETKAEELRVAAEEAEREAQREREKLEDNELGRAVRCPHCRERMTRHTSDDPEKDGALHCDACGCCFKKGARELRDGHSPCALVGA